MYDPTLRLFHLIDNSYGGKLAEFYILADIYKDQKNPNEELQRVLRVEYVNAQLAKGTALVVLNPEDSLEFLIGVFLVLVNIREDVEFRQLSPVRIVNQVEQAQRRIVGVDGGRFFFCDEGGRETRQEKRDQYGRPKTVG